MTRTLILAAVLLTYTTSASATFTVAEYEKVKGHPEFVNFLYGVAEGFMLSQAIYRKNNRGVIYCPPEALQFSQSDYMSLVDHEIANGPHPPGKYISVVLIQGMIKKFPCGKPAPSSE